MAALVPALLAAIADPNASTRACLDTLLDTTFINTIDAPSLALVVPVVHRWVSVCGGGGDREGGQGVEGQLLAVAVVGEMTAMVLCLQLAFDYSSQPVAILQSFKFGLFQPHVTSIRPWRADLQ
jgi:hypothetical protein